MFSKNDDYNFNFAYETSENPHAFFEEIISSWDVIHYFEISIRKQVKEYLCKELGINSIDELSDNERKIFKETFITTLSCLLDHLSDYDCPINIYNPTELAKIDDDFKT